MTKENVIQDNKTQQEIQGKREQFRVPGTKPGELTPVTEGEENLSLFPRILKNDIVWSFELVHKNPVFFPKRPIEEHIILS